MAKDEPEHAPLSPSYLPFLEQSEAASRETRPLGSGPERRRDQDSGFILPRRREAIEPLRVALAPQQLYWVRLAAARAGSKVDESTIVAAGLALLEWMDVDWRTVESRGDLERILARFTKSRHPKGGRAEDPT
jgi:hypothetical protein